MLETPVFETRVPEKQKSKNFGKQKPALEKPQFVREEMNSPMLIKPLIEKPTFQKEHFESVSLRNSKSVEAEKKVVPFPADTEKRWGGIKTDTPKLTINSQHDLKINKSTARR